MRRPAVSLHWAAFVVCAVVLGLGCALVLIAIVALVRVLIGGWETALQVLCTVAFAAVVVWAFETVHEHGGPWRRP